MITIVTDSSAYFKQAEANELGIRIIPLNYTVGNQPYSESFADCNSDFESLLNISSQYSTSHPNTAAFLSAFNEIKGDILCITISSRLSGTYSTAYAAAKETARDDITVFDSQLTAGGLYLLIKKVKSMAENGLDLNSIVEELPKLRDSISITFSVGDMTPLRRSGRIGFVRMNIGTFLNIRPILRCQKGAVVSDGTVRGNNEVVKALLRQISPDSKECVINYIGDNRLATTLYHAISEEYPNIIVTLQKMGPVLGIHLGSKVVAVSVR